MQDTLQVPPFINSAETGDKLKIINQMSQFMQYLGIYLHHFPQTPFIAIKSGNLSALRLVDTKGQYFTNGNMDYLATL